METRKPSKPHLSVKTTVWMMMPILALASWLIPCCSVSGKPEQTGLQVWDPRGKKGTLFKRRHANTSSYLMFHSLLAGGNGGVATSPVPRSRCMSLPVPPALPGVHSHLLYFMGWFSLSSSMLQPPCLAFCTYALPAIDKCQKKQQWFVYFFMNWACNFVQLSICY